MKKVSQKCISMILATLLSVGMCTSCGTTKQMDDGKVKITVGEWPAEGSALELMNNRKAEFEEANPDIEIIPDVWKFDLRTFYPKAEGGMLPDVYAAPFTEVDKLLDGGYAYDVTEIMKEKGIYDNLNKNILDIINIFLLTLKNIKIDDKYALCYYNTYNRL